MDVVLEVEAAMAAIITTRGLARAPPRPWAKILNFLTVKLLKLNYCHFFEMVKLGSYSLSPWVKLLNYARGLKF